MLEIKRIVKTYETVLLGEQALVRVLDNGEERIRRTSIVRKIFRDDNTDTLSFVTNSGTIYTNDQSLLKYQDLIECAIDFSQQ